MHGHLKRGTAVSIGSRSSSSSNTSRLIRNAVSGGQKARIMGLKHLRCFCRIRGLRTTGTGSNEEEEQSAAY
ncbi:hypothetical protein TcasGA2_TC008627 [Tribolium castaneum]|uniref:Uncharacterized protein n=1 Tax=Tribolium castaneum TaxID=7070 RepID=D6WTI8_TRICA|nr:hypothetical protein TcasGA2_TC008627 [Tribolium castaneum]